MIQFVNRLFTLSLIIIVINPCFAEDSLSVFQGKINANNINIRSDSTVTSEVTCKLNQGDSVEVVSELYEWYKIRLPKIAPSFVKNNLVTLIDDKTAKVLKDRVNIRLHPADSAPILGRVDKNEIINILGNRGSWYRIMPVDNSFGWVHKKFVDKAPRTIKIEEAKLTLQIREGLKPESQAATSDEFIIIKGIIRPKTIKRVATHKLITQDKDVFLLKGNKEGFDALNFQRAKVTGKLIDTDKQKNLIIEVVKIEALD